MVRRATRGDKGDKGEKKATRVIKGDKGEKGIGIASVDLVSGNHAAGTFDTYRITLTDNTTYDFQVYNGADGEKGDTGAAGKSLEFRWNGTQLGVRQEGQSSYQYVNLKGDKGDTGPAPDIIVGSVTTLPPGSNATVNRRPGSS